MSLNAKSGRRAGAKPQEDCRESEKNGSDGRESKREKQSKRRDAGCCRTNGVVVVTQQKTMRQCGMQLQKITTRWKTLDKEGTGQVHPGPAVSFQQRVFTPVGLYSVLIRSSNRKGQCSPIWKQRLALPLRSINYLCQLASFLPILNCSAVIPCRVTRRTVRS